MPRHRFTLAALATLAVPGLDVAEARTFTGGGDGAFDAALLTGRDGRHLVARVPTGPAGRRRLDAEAVALAALTAGVRGRLPFDAPAVVGELGAPRTVVTTYVPGARLRGRAVLPDGTLAASIGRALAALHELPTSLAAEHGLPSGDGAAAARDVHALVERTERTGLVPAALTDRWRAAAEGSELWRFRPTVVHGRLGAEDLLTAAGGDGQERVSGVLGWSALGAGDPARDLAWVLGLPRPGAADAVLAAYRSARRQGVEDAELQRRALLHAELEIARWLLHGVDAGDRSIVEDATGMLDALADGVARRTAGSLAHEQARPLNVEEVERLLDARRHQTTGSGAASAATAALQAARSSSGE